MAETDIPRRTYDEYGNEEWVGRNGYLHRLNDPAYISANGNVRIYYLDGKLHNPFGPASISDTQITYWFDGMVPKTILDIIITDQEFDFETFPSATMLENYTNYQNHRAYRIHDPDELVLAILCYS